MNLTLLDVSYKCVWFILLGTASSRLTHVLAFARIFFPFKDEHYCTECFFLFVCFVLFSFFGGRAAPAAYGSSQVRSLIVATAAGLHHSQSNVGSELMATPDP